MVFCCICIQAGAMTDLPIEAVDCRGSRTIEPQDSELMQRCIELSRMGSVEGELPFAALIAEQGKIIAEATNRVIRDKDVTRHAELIALSEAQKTLGQTKLQNCTLYSNVEPCVMCAFPIREARISRVVFAIRSPLMGGFSRWNVLHDERISQVLPEVFAEAPEIFAGLSADEAEKVWRAWNPLIWRFIKQRGCLTASQEPCQHWPGGKRQSGFLRKLLAAMFW
jgi:tRNA(adenine34) deaminase